MSEIPCEKVIKLETEMNHVKERLGDLKGIGENLTRITTLMEMQQESNEKQNILIEQQSTQVNILCGTVENLSDKIESTDKKVEEIDRSFKEEAAKDTINIKDIRNKVIWIAVGIIGTAFVYGIIDVIAKNIK